MSQHVSTSTFSARWESCLSRGKSERQQARVLHGGSGHWKFATLQGSMCKHRSLAGFGRGSNHGNPQWWANQGSAGCVFSTRMNEFREVPQDCVSKCFTLPYSFVMIPNTLLFELQDWKVLFSNNRHQKSDQPTANLILANDCIVIQQEMENYRRVILQRF